MVLQAIKNDPFASIREIRDELKNKRHTFAGWWSIFGVLRKHKLLKKRNRFRYVKKSY